MAHQRLQSFQLLQVLAERWRADMLHIHSTLFLSLVLLWLSIHEVLVLLAPIANVQLLGGWAAHRLGCKLAPFKDLQVRIRTEPVSTCAFDPSVFVPDTKCRQLQQAATDNSQSSSMLASA